MHTTPDDILRTRIAGAYVSDVLSAYETCAYWASIQMAEEGDEPLGNYMAEHNTEPSEALLARFRSDVITFLATCERDGIDLADVDAGQVGHDLWLTRNGHGAGFWDRDDETYGTGQVRNALNSIAQKMGYCDLYVNVDTNTVEALSP